MAAIGSNENPLRVAIIGSGPAGFYTVSNFMKHDVAVEIDMFDRLPTPFGLVRGGVAPDHQKDKSVTRAYDKSASQSNFRFYGNVEFGKDVTLDELRRYYHQIVFSTGAQVDRNLGIPGEDLIGSHSATDFVAWYNGHPDFADLHFDLSREHVAIVGIGNVAVDVARMLCRTHDELKVTDMADYAIEALKNSHVKTVTMLGRRGPAQAAFTPPEIKELGDLIGADVVIADEEARLDPESLAELEASGDKNMQKNVEIVEEISARSVEGRPKQLRIRFLVSPVEIIGDEDGCVKAMQLTKNRIVRTEDGSLKPRATDETEEIPVGLVFRSVGYRGVSLSGVPFNEDSGALYHDHGRVTDEDGKVIGGLYCAGWIKRGPSGVIGTNKTDAQETVASMVEDLQAGRVAEVDEPSISDAAAFVASKVGNLVAYEDWKSIDAEEVSRGEASGRPRVKFTAIDDMLDVLAR
ncbi:MAG: FAD-dependent oxidoreductase [Gammaproteobacteria bacterium]|nr:FAD-dependent oxidoreductase [Gammaproteobacteria bacterium]